MLVIMLVFFSSRYIPSMDESVPSIEPDMGASDNLVKELATALHKSVQIADDHELDNTSESDVEEFNDCEGSEITYKQKHLSRYESFPSARKMMSPSSSDKDDEELESTLQEVFSEEHVSLIP